MPERPVRNRFVAAESQPPTRLAPLRRGPALTATRSLRAAARLCACNIGERTPKQIVAKWSYAGGMDDHHRILDRVRGWCLVGCAAAAIAMTVWEPKPRQRVDVWPAGLD